MLGSIKKSLLKRQGRIWSRTQGGKTGEAHKTIDDVSNLRAQQLLAKLVSGSRSGRVVELRHQEILLLDLYSALVEAIY